MQLFAHQMEIAHHQIIAHAIQDTQESIVNSIFALEKIPQTLLFAWEKEIVLQQTTALVILVILGMNANLLRVMD
jgi:hypothetical protein